jgi:endonuclease YncB( thermonuclease family)
MKINPFLFTLFVAILSIYTLNYSDRANAQVKTGLKTTNDPQEEKITPILIKQEDLSLPDLSQASITIKAMTVIDGKTFTDYKGNTYTLSSLDIGFDKQNYAMQSKELLDYLIKDQTLIIFKTKKDNIGRQNRLGHTIVHAVRETDKTWIQATLLANGLARVRTTEFNPEQSTTLLQHEATANKSNKGIWNDDAYKTLNPTTAIDNIGAFHVIEGTIKKVATTKNNIYLNFGDNWKTDFTIGIAPNVRRSLSKKNINAQEWAHKKVRVRGWIRSYNGPYIELSHIEQIEFIKEEP